MNLSDVAANEPVIISAAAGAVVTLGAAFGLPITPDQKVAIISAAVPITLLVGAILTRRAVTPNAKVADITASAVAAVQAPAAGQ